MSDAGFETGLAAVLQFEGGYSNDPDDRGGETNMGISKRQFPDLDIKNLTLAQATNIYRYRYWNTCHCSGMPDAIGAKVFETAVLVGTDTAIKLLQRALNHQDCRSALLIDGVPGPLTLLATRTSSESLLLLRLRIECRNHYLSIAASTPTQGKFLAGWLRRADN